MSETHSLPDDAVLIVGAGLAGLFLALKLAPRPVYIMMARPLGEGSASAWAQGGIAAALSLEDSPRLHALDTIAAGNGLVEESIAYLLAEEGPARVRDLMDFGVPFDHRGNGDLELSLEAAHSRARVARVKGDLAGRAIMDALTTRTRAASHIHFIEGTAATAILTDHGGAAGVLGRDVSGQLIAYKARETVLATGGVGGLYRVTTNPQSAVGSGIAMAYRAGAMIADPEFVQFHPTAIDIGRDPAPLATEALRGEGSKLVNADGRTFMRDYAEAGEMAPRDVVARAIASEIAAGRKVFLDTRDAVGAHFPDHFPTVFSVCMTAGIDPRTACIPVAPAAHYHMGGVATDMWGRTTLDGLSACGECASSGAHGANRLASNSLLEAVVFADRIATRIKASSPRAAQGEPKAEAAAYMPAPALKRLRAAMSLKAGVTRDANGLQDVLTLITELEAKYGAAFPLISARLIASAALAREESRGGHYRSDFPNLGPKAVRTFLSAQHQDDTVPSSPAKAAS